MFMEECFEPWCYILIKVRHCLPVEEWQGLGGYRKIFLRKDPYGKLYFSMRKIWSYTLLHLKFTQNQINLEIELKYFFNSNYIWSKQQCPNFWNYFYRSIFLLKRESRYIILSGMYDKKLSFYFLCFSV